MKLLTFALLFAWLPADRSGAAVITVSKGGPITTIQAGLDAANAGDKVKVKAGTYRENIDVASGLDGLSLEAAGRVVIEARADGGVKSGPAIMVRAPDVTISGFWIQNAGHASGADDDQGHGILFKQAGLTVKNCFIRGCDGDGIHYDADFAEGDGLTVTKVKFNGVGGCVNVDGDDVSIKGIAASNVRDTAVRIVGDRASVKNADLHGVGIHFVEILGNDARVEKNHCWSAQLGGIVVTGDGARVAKNKLTATGGPAIRTDGDLPQVIGNRIEQTFSDAPGLQVLNAGTGGLLGNNLVDNASGHGIEVTSSCASVRILRNTITRAGRATGSGLHVRGNGHSVENNLAKAGSGDGFNLDGVSLTVSGNQSISNSRDGFDLEGGSGSTLSGNRADQNGAEGIEINAAGATINGNRSTRNRTDFSTDAGGAFSGNTSSDGTDAAPPAPEID